MVLLSALVFTYNELHYLKGVKTRKVMIIIILWQIHFIDLKKVECVNSVKIFQPSKSITPFITPIIQKSKENIGAISSLKSICKDNTNTG